MRYLIKRILAERRKFAKEKSSLRFMSNYILHHNMLADAGAENVIGELNLAQEPILQGAKSITEIYGRFRDMPSAIQRGKKELAEENKPIVKDSNYYYHKGHKHAFETKGLGIDTLEDKESLGGFNSGKELYFFYQNRNK